MNCAHATGSRSPTVLPRVDVLGVGISAVDMPGAVAEIERWIVQRESHYVCVTGVHGVMESQDDPALRDIHNASGLTVPDGMPMVWAGRYAGFSQMARVAGPDLLPAVCAVGAERGWRHYFYGGAPGVAERLADVLAGRFPGLRVVGTHSPPFRPLTDAEARSITQQINAASPDCLWVGLSTPKQERWMAATANLLAVPATLGVGAAFDMHAGSLRRAPGWMQRSGLEWLYRLAAEPRRLAGRYLKNNPRFAWRIVRRPPRPFA